MVGPRKQDFWPRINILKGNHCILRTRGAPVRQKLGMILENKVVQKLKLEKDDFYNKWSPKFPLSMLILAQKSCILGPTIFRIPQPN